MAKDSYFINYVTPPCLKCGETTELKLKVSEWVDWRNGLPVQHAFPDLSPNERELVMTGIHPKCWEEMFIEDAFSDD